jgi:hypothetical protein
MDPDTGAMFTEWHIDPEDCWKRSERGTVFWSTCVDRLMAVLPLVTYSQALQRELLDRGLRVGREVSVNIMSKGITLTSQRLDFVVVPTVRQLPMARTRLRRVLRSRARAVHARFDRTDRTLHVLLVNGGQFSVPVSYIPQLKRASDDQIAAVEVDAIGLGMHWKRSMQT